MCFFMPSASSADLTQSPEGLCHLLTGSYGDAQAMHQGRVAEIADQDSTRKQGVINPLAILVGW